jgi:hypothetical protein
MFLIAFLVYIFLILSFFVPFNIVTDLLFLTSHFRPFPWFTFTDKRNDNGLTASLILGVGRMVAHDIILQSFCSWCHPAEFGSRYHPSGCWLIIPSYRVWHVDTILRSVSSSYHQAVLAHDTNLQSLVGWLFRSFVCLFNSINLIYDAFIYLFSHLMCLWATITQSV